MPRRKTPCSAPCVNSSSSFTITADPDGDGLPNLLEYLADTNPTMASPKSEIRGQSRGFVSGQWPVVGGQRLEAGCQIPDAGFQMLRTKPSALRAAFSFRFVRSLAAMRLRVVHVFLRRAWNRRAQRSALFRLTRSGWWRLPEAKSAARVWP